MLLNITTPRGWKMDAASRADRKGCTMTNLTRRSFLLGSLGIAGMLGLSGCGNSTASVTKYAVGDTVETDLVKFTLDNTCFAIALEKSFPVGCDFYGNTAYGSNYSKLDYFTPKEYSAEDDSDNPFVAPKGNILVYVEMTIENLDRASLELDESLNDEFATLQYNGTEYQIDIFEDRNKRYGIEADSEGNWEALGVSNLLLSASSTATYRAYYCYPVEPESPDDPFEITFQLPKSDDTTESFTFAVNQ